MEELDQKEGLSQNGLDDIVLEKYEKKEKLKRTILLIASGLAVFLIVLGGVKYFIDSTSAPQESLIDEKITTQQSGEPEDMFEEVPILSAQEQEQPTNDHEELNKIVQDVLKKKEHDAATLQESGKKDITDSSQPTPSSKKIEKTKARQQQPQTTKNVTKKQEHKVQQTTKKYYYVQVGAFLKYPPDKAFLRKIEAAGYNYTIKKVTIGGRKVQKVLIGPFSSKEKARKVLRSIKKKLVPGAFIVRL